MHKSLPENVHRCVHTRRIIYVSRSEKIKATDRPGLTHDDKKYYNTTCNTYAKKIYYVYNKTMEEKNGHHELESLERSICNRSKPLRSNWS